jgi:hypothetical protein
MDIDTEFSNFCFGTHFKIFITNEGECFIWCNILFIKIFKKFNKSLKNITCYIYKSSFGIVISLSLQNSNLIAEEPKS